MEARGVLFTLVRPDMPENERKLLYAAYEPVCSYIIERDLKISEEKELMM